MRTQKGQSTAEYAIVISLVIAAVIGMQIYVKRGMQAKFKQAADYYSGQGAGTGTITNQYEPYYSQSNLTVTTGATAQEKAALNGVFNKNAINEWTNRVGNQTTGADQAAAASWK